MLLNTDNSGQAFDDFVTDLSVRSGPNDGTVQGSAIGVYRGSPDRGLQPQRHGTFSQ